MNKGIENRELIKRIILNNDQNAFNSFYNTYYNPLVRFCFSITKQLHVSEDIVSEIFLRFLKNKDTSLNILNLDSYLFNSVKYDAIKFLKRSKIKLDQEYDKNLCDEQSPLQSLLFYELDAILDEAVAQMPVKRKQIFQMVKNDGLKYKEVAEKLGISVKTVENQMTQALSSLRAVINTKYQVPNAKSNISNVELSILIAVLYSYLLF